MYNNDSKNPDTHHLTSMLIKPLPKVSKEDVEKLDQANNISLWNKLYQDKKEHQQMRSESEKELLYTQALNKYINRICLNSECHKNMLVDKCIDNCILFGNNIQYSQFDGTSIYHFPNYGYVFTQECLKQTLNFYPPITDQILINTFQINTIELHDLKIQLVNNPLIKFINQHWAEYSNEEKFDILLILLNPAEKRVNPVTFKRNILDCQH